MACLTSRAPDATRSRRIGRGKSANCPPSGKAAVKSSALKSTDFLPQIPNKAAAIELRLALAGSPLLLRNYHPKEPLPEVCKCPIPEVKPSFGVREGAE